MQKREQYTTPSQRTGTMQNKSSHSTATVASREINVRRLRRDQFNRELKRDGMLVLSVVSLTALVSISLLWSIGLLGSGKWEKNASPLVSFVKDQTEWHSLLRDSTKPLFLAFYSETCPGCKRMRYPFLQAAADPKTSNVQFVAINSASSGAVNLANSLNIKFVPALLFISSPNANAVEYKGGASKNRIVDFLQTQLKLIPKQKTVQELNQESTQMK